MPADTAHNDQLRSFVLNSNETEIEKNLRSIGESIGLYGESETIRTIIRDVCRVAPSDVAVLVIGESGTGKDVVAKAIHQLSARRNKPLVIVNSGAIAEGILESELFGHERGAFTGAVSERKGYFETANGGTIFLDEIGDMPLQTQVKLLRVLETGEFLKVGGSVVRRCDVRVIGATNRNLEQMVRRGEFRKDLYYRLKAITITMPPLRQRRADIPV
ncbi:MAG TPA: sigma-54 factor interaction domain-containing protein, partial [bacterium]|nr:sigma-54 factor interaction domain-containing protein [bacterium]